MGHVEGDAWGRFYNLRIKMLDISHVQLVRPIGSQFTYEWPK